MRVNHILNGIRLGLLTGALVLISACQPAPASVPASTAAAHTPTPTFNDASPLEYQGNGAGKVQFQPWSGPAVVHVFASGGSAALKVSIAAGLEESELVSGQPPLDEYRGFEFAARAKAELVVQGDSQWKVSVLPVSPRYFTMLKIPGKYSGTGGAVLIMDGAHGVATFDTQDYAGLNAWAYGPGGVGEKLYIKPDGDYRGKTVLPEGAGWVIVSARNPWSVEIQAPCCVEPPGL
jgi:hypothetical protein